MSRVIQHIYRIFDSHQEVIHLVELILVLDHLLHQVGVQAALPVEESASGGLSHVLLPVRNQIQLPVPVVNLLQLFRREGRPLHQIHAVSDNGAPQLVVATAVALQNSDQQLEHILEGEALFEFVDVLSAVFDKASDQLACIPVDEDDPCIDQVFLSLKLDLDCFKHLDSLEDGRE